MFGRFLILFSLVAVVSSTARANGGQGTVLRFGAETQIRNVAKADPESELVAALDGESVSVAMVWEWYWIVAPFWSSGRTYAFYRGQDPFDNQTEFFEFEMQTREEVARVTGIPEEQLKFPLMSYVPPGWPLIAGMLCVVQLISGPSPRRRFRRLMADDDYVRALELIVESEEDSGGEDQMDSESEASAANPFDDATDYLVRQGISENKAGRDLDFLIGYLQSHPNTEIPLSSIAAHRQRQI